MAFAERLSLNPNRAGSRCAAASALGVSDIDWRAPWLADWRAVGEPMAQQVATGCPQHQALNMPDLATVRFVLDVCDLSNGVFAVTRRSSRGRDLIWLPLV